MPVRVYKCTRCSQITQIEWVTGTQPKCKCGSNQLQRISFQQVATTPPPSPPTIPTAPPMGDFTPPSGSPPKPGGLSLLQGIQASKVGKLDPTTGARFVNRNALDQSAYDRYWTQATASLPPMNAVTPGSREEVAKVIRCVVNNCKATSVGGRQIDFFFGGQKYLFKGLVTVDLTLPLSEMAKGQCRPAEHGNSNTSWGNIESQLPVWVGDEKITYLEFGWRYRVPQSLMKNSRTRDGRNIPFIEVTTATGGEVDFGKKSAIARRINSDGGTIEAGLRLVISSWGYLFFSNTHYRSFLIYDPSSEKWKAYGETKNADVSWYQSGEKNPNWILPVSAPGYW